MNKPLSLIATLLGAFIAIEYFGFYNLSSAIGFNMALAGAICLIVFQVLSFFKYYFSNGNVSYVGVIIKTVMALPGILYLMNYLSILNIGIQLEIIISLFLFSEGIYGLH